MPVSLKDFQSVKLPLGQTIKETLAMVGSEADPKTKAREVPLFGIFILADDSCLAAWENHFVHAPTMDELKKSLNGHEQTLLKYKVKS